MLFDHLVNSILYSTIDGKSIGNLAVPAVCLKVCSTIRCLLNSKGLRRVRCAIEGAVNTRILCVLSGKKSSMAIISQCNETRVSSSWKLALWRARFGDIYNIYYTISSSSSSYSSIVSRNHHIIIKTNNTSRRGGLRAQYTTYNNIMVA